MRVYNASNATAQYNPRAAIAPKVRGAAATGLRADRPSFSPQSKLMHALESLTAQKERVNESKSKLITDTLEKGFELSKIEPQLELFEEQLECIDDQIAQLTAQQLQKTGEEANEKRAPAAPPPQSEAQAQQAALHRLVSVSDTLRHAATVSSAQQRAQGTARSKAAEIKMDSLQIQRLRDKAKTGADTSYMVRNAKEVLAEKKSTVRDLQNKATQLRAQHGETLGDARAALQENQETAAAAPHAQPQEDHT